MALLEVKNISKKFGNSEVLKDIHFSAEKGTITAIIGSSGSGKTTLLRCINFLETADSGTILVNGETVFDAISTQKLTRREKNERQLKFGLVFQQFNLFPQYTVTKNLTIAAELQAKADVKKGKNSKAELKEKYRAISEKADLLLKKVGLYEKRNAYPSALSGGQCQRVAIARALMLEPTILCFDEPTSALDPELTGEVLKVVKALKSDERTMIIVTHEMEFAHNVADRVIFMADGIIEEEGSPADIFENPQSPKTKAFLRSSDAMSE